MKLRSGRFTFLLLVFWQNNAAAQQLLQPIGQWRDQLPYKTAVDITAAVDKIYCATPFSVFSVDIAENSIDRFSKVTGLSETGVAAIEYDGSTEKLLITYTNSNIDILYRNDIINIPDIKRDNIQANKTINSIYPLSGNFYLSTGLGIIIIDAEKYEVKDTWIIGNNGSYTNVNAFAVSGSDFYAATDEGLKKTNGSNPPNSQNWKLQSGQNGLPAGVCKNILIAEGKPIVVINESIFILNNGVWNLLYEDAAWKINSVNVSGNKILVSEINNATGRVLVMNTFGAVAEILQNNISNPAKAISFQNNYWVADKNNSLIKYSSGAGNSFRPNSPDFIATGQLIVNDNILYAAAGSITSQWQPIQNKNGLYKFSDGSWINYNASFNQALDSLTDIITVAPDKSDNSVWAGSYSGGLLHIKADNRFEIFKQNSPIKEAVFDAGSYRVSGLVFDNENNLWVANYGAVQYLHVKKSDGSWHSFIIPFTLNENAVSQIIMDDLNQKWIISPKGNGLICFNDNNTIDDTGDDKWKLYRYGNGAGNLPSNNVLSIVKDKSGFIWVGTDDGIAIIQCPQEAFSQQGCEAIIPIAQQGNFAQYLFKGEQVNNITADGADRKWIATNNGVWLISADGEKTIYRFTEANSSLLSDIVKSIAIDGKTGEVFFGTAKGICSWRSTATEGGINNENVLVFPNPVPPGYSGTIAIRGLVDNAIVKITEMDGRLVYQTRALGGQAVWGGKDYKGRKISSGVYLVLVSDEAKKEKAAGKIVFIAK